MALIECDECDNDVSSKAVACPNCGYPMADQMSDSDQLNQSRQQKSNGNGAYSESHIALTNKTNRKDGESVAGGSGSRKLSKPNSKTVGCWFGGLVFIAPYLFAWPIISNYRYKISSRKLTYGWLAVFCMAYITMPLMNVLDAKTTYDVEDFIPLLLASFTCGLVLAVASFAYKGSKKAGGSGENGRASPLTVLGITFVPHLFSWATLSSRYSKSATFFAFLWLSLYSVALTVGVAAYIHEEQPQAQRSAEDTSVDRNAEQESDAQDVETSFTIYEIQDGHGILSRKYQDRALLGCWVGSMDSWKYKFWYTDGQNAYEAVHNADGELRRPGWPIELKTDDIDGQVVFRHPDEEIIHSTIDEDGNLRNWEVRPGEGTVNYNTRQAWRQACRPVNDQ